MDDPKGQISHKKQLNKAHFLTFIEESEWNSFGGQIWGQGLLSSFRERKIRKEPCYMFSSAHSH